MKTLVILATTCIIMAWGCAGAQMPDAAKKSLPIHPRITDIMQNAEFIGLAGHRRTEPTDLKADLTQDPLFRTIISIEPIPYSEDRRELEAYHTDFGPQLRIDILNATDRHNAMMARDLYDQPYAGAAGLGRNREELFYAPIYSGIPYLAVFMPGENKPIIFEPIVFHEGDQLYQAFRREGFWREYEQLNPAPSP